MFKQYIKTPLGDMVALADDKALHFLDFNDRPTLPASSPATASENAITAHIREELDAYFKGSLKQFKTPILMQGTDFQRETWEALCAIPYGETLSYQAQAERINKPKAFRAVANANGQNKFSILVPCHRVIRSNSSLGGYGGGIERKKWLLNHERTHKSEF